jgi:serine/threonine protein kinase
MIDIRLNTTNLDYDMPCLAPAHLTFEGENQVIPEVLEVGQLHSSSNAVKLPQSGSLLVNKLQSDVEKFAEKADKLEVYIKPTQLCFCNHKYIPFILEECKYICKEGKGGSCIVSTIFTETKLRLAMKFYLKKSSLNHNARQNEMKVYQKLWAMEDPMAPICYGYYKKKSRFSELSRNDASYERNEEEDIYSSDIQDNNEYFFVITEAAICSLNDLLQYEHLMKIEWTSHELLSFMGASYQAMRILHKNGIVHRDIKPSNLLIFLDSQGILNIRLADLGSALCIPSNIDLIDKPTDGYTEGFCAPEIISVDSKKYNPYIADMCSLGKTMKLFTQKIQTLKDKKSWDKIQRIITKMKRKKPNERITEEDLEKSVIKHYLKSELHNIDRSIIRACARSRAQKLLLPTNLPSETRWHGQCYQLSYLEELRNNSESNHFIRDGTPVGTEIDRSKVMNFPVKRQYLRSPLRTPNFESSSLDMHSKGIQCFLYLQDQAKLFTGGHDNKIKVWDITTWQMRSEHSGHEYIVTKIIQLDDHHIASSSKDNTIKIWYIKTMMVTQTLRGHFESVHALALLSPDYMISGSADDNVIVWKKVDNMFSCPMILPQESCKALLTLSAGSFAAGSKQAINIYERNEEWKIKIKLQGHTAIVEDLKLIGKETNQFLLSASSDKTCKMWDLNTGTILKIFSGHTSPVSSIVVISNSIFVSISVEIRCWNYETNQSRIIPYKNYKNGDTHCITAIKDQRYIVGGKLKNLEVWNYGNVLI